MNAREPLRRRAVPRTPILRWLEQTTDLEEEHGLAVSAEIPEQVVPWSSTRRPRDPLATQIGLPDSLVGVAAGVLAALLALALIVRRELRVARRLRAAGTITRGGGGDGVWHPSWVEPEEATLQVVGDAAIGPYRATPRSDVRVAPADMARRALLRLIGRLAARAVDGAARWLLFAWVVGALAYGLLSLIPR